MDPIHERTTQIWTFLNELFNSINQCHTLVIGKRRPPCSELIRYFNFPHFMSMTHYS